MRKKPNAREALLANDVQINVLLDALSDYVGQRHLAVEQLDLMAKRLRSGETHGLFAPGEAGATAADRMAQGHRDLETEAQRIINLVSDTTEEDEA